MQSGDVGSSNATDPAVLRLRKALEFCCSRPHCPAVNELAIVLRISGSIWWFEGEGLQKLRLSRKGAYVTVDLVVPEHRWRELDARAFEHYLAAGARDAIKAMAERLQRARLPVDTAGLYRDVDAAIEAFLAGRAAKR